MFDEIMQKIPIFIGRKPHQWLPMEVLLSSIKRRTQAELEFHELKYLPLNLKSKKGANFTLYRFSIPQMMGWKGRAIYLDSEFLVFGDILELYNAEMNQHGVLAQPVGKDSSSGHYTDAMLLDTEKLQDWKLNEFCEKINLNPSFYNDILWASEKSMIGKDFGDFPESWNPQDKWNASTKLLQFKEVAAQPWKNSSNPFSSLFLRELKKSIECGDLPLDAVQNEIRHGLIYPQILDEMKKNIY